MLKFLAFLFNFKQFEVPQKCLPAPQHIEQKLEDKEMDRETYLKNMIQAIGNSTDSPENIELQIYLLEAEFAKDGRVVEIFHRDVVKMKNERLEDPALDTKEGTRRALQELAIYAAKVDNELKIPKISDPKNAESSVLAYCWRD